MPSHLESYFAERPEKEADVRAFWIVTSLVERGKETKLAESKSSCPLHGFETSKRWAFTEGRIRNDSDTFVVSISPAFTSASPRLTASLILQQMLEPPKVPFEPPHAVRSVQSSKTITPPAPTWASSPSWAPSGC
jgi:hypothetical protein